MFQKRMRFSKRIGISHVFSKCFPVFGLQLFIWKHGRANRNWTRFSAGTAPWGKVSLRKKDYWDFFSVSPDSFTLKKAWAHEVTSRLLSKTHSHIKSTESKWAFPKRQMFCSMSQHCACTGTAVPGPLFHHCCWSPTQAKLVLCLQQLHSFCSGT